MKSHTLEGVYTYGRSPIPPLRREQRTMIELQGIDYIELFVGNAYQAAHFYRATFGFTPVAYAGVETGVTDRTSFVVQQGDVRLVFTSSLDPQHPIADHVKLHGDSIQDIAFCVPDAAYAFAEAVRRGARPVMEPTVFEYRGERMIKATIGVYGDTVHSFVEHGLSAGVYGPGYRPIKQPQPSTPVGITAIDHIAVCLEEGTLDEWVAFYQRVFDFHQLHEEAVETEFSAMNSKAVESPNGTIKFPLMEPAPSKRRSQIEDYLLYHQGAGAQHMAVLSTNIVQTVRQLRANGIEFRVTPGAYYDSLTERVGAVAAPLAILREQHILVDRDATGYLMQIFAKPVQGRPTLFCEIIERAGATGFGSGNIKALFQSIEREQTILDD